MTFFLIEIYSKEETERKVEKYEKQSGGKDTSAASEVLEEADRRDGQNWRENESKDSIGKGMRRPMHTFTLVEKRSKTRMCRQWRKKTIFSSSEVEERYVMVVR